MIVIYSSVIEKSDLDTRIVTDFEVNNERFQLWYSFDNKYSEFLVTENSDSALVSLLLLAMKEGQDIYVKGQVSEKLYYQINHYLINALSLANDKLKKINITVERLNSNSLNRKSCTGTGVSCGVDSFSTIFDHLNEKDNYKIDYFTFFNAGSHGEFGGEKARQVFKERLALVKPFADEFKTEIITVDTNLNEILLMNHQQTHTLRDVACILNLQKLFKYYYYASAYRFDYFKLDPISPTKYEILILNMLSTESTTFYSSVSQFNRVERTRNISKFEYTYRYLNVCIASSSTGVVKNCSVCDKCLRTELTLDLLGELDKYNKIFDIDKYNKVKDKYIGKILCDKNIDMFSKEIFDLIKEVKYDITLKSKMYYLIFKVKKILKQLIKF